MADAAAAAVRARIAGRVGQGHTAARWGSKARVGSGSGGVPIGFGETAGFVSFHKHGVLMGPAWAAS